MASFRNYIAGALFFACAGAAPAHAGGVTVITHGFASTVNDWIMSMAGKVGGYPGFPGATYSCYVISITRNAAGQYVASASRIGGLPPSQTDSGEIVVKLDWSTLSSNGTSTTTVAQAAANALLSTSLIPEMGGHPLAELPLHFVGHSRGGSVITEMARFLGAQGAWVDHVTTLDPHPLAQYSDATATTWSNVLYADNFWQTLGDDLFVPNGRSVFGAYNRKLLDLNGGYSSSHFDVHLWYHGTIDLATPTNDTQAVIMPTQRATWWTAAETSGANAGWFYSLLGRGDRLSELEPAGVGTGKISDGFNRNWNLGGGLALNRSALPTNAGLWPNPIRLSITAGAQSFDIALRYQAGASASGTITADVLLDLDANPYDSNEVALGQWMLPKSGTNAVLSGTWNALIPATVSPGSYNVCVRLIDDGRVRYLYARERLTVAPTIDAGSLGRSGGSVRFDVHGAIGQTVTVQASTDCQTWNALETHTFTGTTWQFTDAQANDFPRRFYRLLFATP